MDPVLFITIGSNVVVGIVGFLARHAFNQQGEQFRALQSTVQHLNAGQIATEKIVAVMEARFGGELTTLKEDLRILRGRVNRLDGRTTGEFRVITAGPRGGRNEEDDD